MIQKLEIVEKIIKINRCTTVTKGGRKFGFSILAIIGNKNGKCGFGLGKGIEITDAKAKALQQARKNIFKFILKQNRTLYHNVIGKFCSSKIIMKPASLGTGIISGGATRILFKALGIKDIVTKSIGSNNAHNLIKATIRGLKNMNTPKQINNKRNKRII